MSKSPEQVRILLKTTILVEPTAKGRPRMTTINGHAHAFTPAKTRDAETAIQYSIRQKQMTMPSKDTALALTVTFYRAKPLHLPKRTTLPTTKPDTGNYLKCVLDAGNGYLWPDDSQITTIIARKRYCQLGESPRIYLELSEEA